MFVSFAKGWRNGLIVTQRESVSAGVVDCVKSGLQLDQNIRVARGKRNDDTDRADGERLGLGSGRETEEG